MRLQRAEQVDDVRVPGIRLERFAETNRDADFLQRLRGLSDLGDITRQYPAKAGARLNKNFHGCRALLWNDTGVLRSRH